LIEPVIKAVIFDFGKVICDFDIGIFLDRAAAYSSNSAQSLRSAMNSLKDVAIRYETGLMTSDDYYLEICRAASLRMPRDEFIRAYADIFTPIPTTFDLIRQLAPRYRLGLLSNTGEWHFEYAIRTTDIFPLFDTVTLSYEAKSMKPDHRIYEDALGKLGLPAAACAYIDDIQENVDAGRLLGLRAIHFTTPLALRSELQRIGVEV
jgi:putative hydrolase of the HAD superfamily